MSVEGSDPQSREGKKSQKVSDSHRNDVSPLTQGLRYRAACDLNQVSQGFLAGRAYATLLLLRPLSVVYTECIVAKRCALEQKVLLAA